MCSLGYSCVYDSAGKLLCQCLAEDKARCHILSLFFFFSSLFRTSLNTYDLLRLCTVQTTILACVGAYAGLRSCSCLFSSLPRSRLVTTQPGQNNMDTTVAEWPFWVKALCNNKQLLAPRSCFPAADRCQNTELTAIPFTAVEKHQPSKPTYLQRL